MRITKFLASFLLISAFASSSQATLLDGKSIGYNYYHNEVLWQDGTAVVGPGVEIPELVWVASLDASDTQLKLSFFESTFFPVVSPSLLNGLEVFDVANAIAAITAVDVVTNVAGFNASRVTFDADHVWINLLGLTYNIGDTITVNLTGPSTGSEVPEPGTFALAGLALVGLARLRCGKQG